MASMKGAIVFVVRGGPKTCTFATRAIRLQNAGVILLLHFLFHISVYVWYGMVECRRQVNVGGE
jgi:hypothetical protein